MSRADYDYDPGDADDRPDPREVLDDEELAEYYAFQRGRSFHHTAARFGRYLDDAGLDSDGYAWGARGA